MALTRLGLNQSVNLASNVTGTLPVANGGTALTSGFINGVANVGKVAQVVSGHRNTPNSFSSSGTNTFADMGITLDITPSSTSSKIYLVATTHVTQSTSATIHVRLLRDSTVINSGDPQTNQLSSMLSSREESGTPYGLALFNLTNNFLDSPNTTSQITYKLQGTLGASYTGTYWINRTNNDSDADYGARHASNLTAMEILA